MFPIQQRLLTPNKYSRPQTRIQKVSGIVIHWTANENRGADAEANRRFFENRKLGRTGFGSAHYFVDDKEIVQCIPDGEIAYHVGATSYKTKQFGSYPNNCTLGIEMCVNSDGDFKVVYQQTVELTALLVKQYGLNPDNDIVRHFDVTGKNCPAYFTSNHWGKTNHAYAVKYGLGANADVAWKNFINQVKLQSAPKAKPVAQVVKAKPAAKPAPKPVAKPKYVLPTGVYRKGDKGSAVKQIQNALNAAGFKCGVADGAFGAATEDALKRFQSMYCNPADGVYGPATKAALHKKING